MEEKKINYFDTPLQNRKRGKVEMAVMRLVFGQKKEDEEESEENQNDNR